MTGVNVTVQLPALDQGTEVLEVAAAARQMMATVCGGSSGLDCYLTGSVMLDHAFQESSERDVRTLVPLMLVVVVVALALLLRSLSGTLITVCIVFLSILATLGLAGWLGIALSPSSAAAPNILLTLAVADSVHILASFLQGMRKGLEKRAAMVESLRLNFQAVFFTNLTTALGFLSMNSSDAPPFRDLGNITAMGVGIALLLSVTLLPTAMMVLPVRGGTEHTWIEGLMARLAELVIRRRGRLLWIMAAVCMGLGACIPRNELNDGLVKYFDETVDFRRATDFTTAHLTGIYYIDYSLGAGRPEGISDPAFLAKVEEFADWYRAQPETLHVNVITDIFKRLNKNMHGDDPAWYRLPEERELAAQYLLRYEMSLPQGLDLNDRINVDKSATRMTVTLKSLSSNQVLALEQRAQAWLRSHAPASMQVAGSGPTLMFAHIGQRNIVSMLSGEIMAIVLISLMLIAVLRTLRIGLLSLVPNLLPVAVAFGLWGLWVGQVGLAASVVAAMTLGILVDDTVHFLSKYLSGRRQQGLSPPEAVRYAFSSVGHALAVTSVVLVAGFLVLAFSSFKINSDLGLLTAIILALGLMADFLLLPPLLMKIEEQRDETRTVVCPADGSGAVCGAGRNP